MYMLTPEQPCYIVCMYLCFQYAVADNDDQTDVIEPTGIQTVTLIGG